MACLHPRVAWRNPSGVLARKEPGDVSGWTPLRLPCGGCIGCRVRRARDWAIRCQLELQEHDCAAWVTLTYDEQHVPRPFDQAVPTLRKADLSAYIKRLRARVHPRQVRFFGVGEYGEQGNRPHYHVIVYGLPREERHLEGAWTFGFARADPVTPASIAYTAGYAQKKIAQAAAFTLPQPFVCEDPSADVVDPETGEVIAEGIRIWEFEQPFRLPSRRPGIGAAARRHVGSWRRSAIWRGQEVPVPRYLHAAWEAVASESDLKDLERELSALEPRTPRQREAAELLARVKYEHQTLRRKL